MTIKKSGPNMTELVFNDGTRVLVSYETPCAAFMPFDMLPGGTWVRLARAVSRTTSQHVTAWLADNMPAGGRAVPISEREMSNILGRY